MTETNEDQIEKTVEIAAPVPRVWRALTDHEEFGDGSEFDWMVRSRLARRRPGISPIPATRTWSGCPQPNAWTTRSCSRFRGRRAP